jgi:hypothetical protein
MTRGLTLDPMASSPFNFDTARSAQPEPWLRAIAIR